MAFELDSYKTHNVACALQEMYGVDFTNYEENSLGRRLNRAMITFGVENEESFYDRLKNETDFIHKLVDEITVGMTSLFRDAELWKKVGQKVLPILKSKPNVNFWHVGCSTGEELLTLAIVLDQHKFQPEVKRLATDINRQYLKRAGKVQYSFLKLKQFEASYRAYGSTVPLNNYYNLKAHQATFDPALVEDIDFRYHNILTDAIDEKFDVIFCRNVMIYFKLDTKDHLLRRFYNALNDGGFLVIGDFDALMPVTDRKYFDYFDTSHKILRKAKNIRKYTFLG